MTVEHFYVCDLCGSRADTAKGFCNVSVDVAPFPSTANGNSPFATPPHKAQVCRPCLEIKLGIYVSKETKAEQPEAWEPPTIEQAIRELVNRVIDDRGSQ